MKIIRPTLLLDQGKCLANIRRMSVKASQNRTGFRPHFKTHQSAAVGEWFRNEGVHRITVSSIEMARYFADSGWTDITLAIPVNILQIEEIRELCERIRLNLVVSSADSIPILIQGGFRGGIWLKIDAGYHRAGLQPADIREIRRIAETVTGSGTLDFMGLLSHFGNTYHASSPEEVKSVFRESMDLLKGLQHLLSADFGPVPLSIGDTPSCSIVEDLTGADEIRPGNFVFYDVMQALIGSCTFRDIAVCLAVPVLEVNRSRSEALVHAGAVHLSKEQISLEGTGIYGLVAGLTETGWTGPLPGCYVKSLSQEHGILNLSKDLMATLSPGEVVGILPVHSCLAVSGMRLYITLSGERLSCFDPLTS